MSASRDCFSGNAVVTPGEIADQEGDKTAANRLSQCVFDELDRYFATLDGEEPAELHRLVMAQTEEALLRYMMNHCRDNQSRVAEYLGLNRGTLRKRLKAYEIT